MFIQMAIKKSLELVIKININQGNVRKKYIKGNSEKLMS